MQPIEIGTSVRLTRAIEDVRSVVSTDRSRRVDRLPDGRTCLVLRVMSSGRRGDLTVLGPRTRALLKDVHGCAQAVLFTLKPGWSTPVLGVPANELTNRHVPLEDLWGSPGRDLLFELLNTQGLPQMSARVLRACASRAPAAVEPASAPLARRAVRMMEVEDVRVESVADRLGVTARHLRRAFADNIGVGPKEFARSARLRRAVRMAATSSDWARIATDAGYYDQAHLISDFRDLVGLTPSAFAKRAKA